MTELQPLSALLIGLAGGIHCIGMCGGLSAALTLSIPKGQSQWPFLLSYNVGRIISYTIAGAIAGGLGAMLGQQFRYGLAWMTLFSAIMLMCLALYLSGWWRGLVHLERAGSLVWRKISPLSRTFLPFRRPLSALPYGMIWGWLPCGLVYSTLSWSLAANSAINGALVMFWFGAGTLPALLATGAAGHRLKMIINQKYFKTGVALLLLVFSWALIWRTVILFNSL